MAPSGGPRDTTVCGNAQREGSTLRSLARCHPQQPQPHGRVPQPHHAAAGQCATPAEGCSVTGKQFATVEQAALDAALGPAARNMAATEPGQPRPQPFGGASREPNTAVNLREHPGNRSTLWRSGFPVQPINSVPYCTTLQHRPPSLRPLGSPGSGGSKFRLGGGGGGGGLRN